MIELARLGHVTQPRMSQIMALNQLAPTSRKPCSTYRRPRASPRSTRSGSAQSQPCSPGKNSELRGSISATRLGSKTSLWKSLSIKSEKIFLPVFPAEFEQFRKIPFSHDQSVKEVAFNTPTTLPKASNLETLVFNESHGCVST